ncbi:MAG: hypothetical protein HY706_03465 [Candidatus Hydrogenedentes bacterium]|nr:hypothetical protein [Candidatus Hydrogenedentota bacterium]
MKRAPIVLLVLLCSSAYAEEALTEADAHTALERAVTFFRTQVSASGSYLWRYSTDLTKREGEGKASATTGWVQPPGTPTVGHAYLRAYESTGERYLLEAAIETGHALVMGQLKSGGWDYRIEFDADARRKCSYRKGPESAHGSNVTTLDDNTTQEAVRFLMRLDEALDFKNSDIHECVTYALAELLKAQYPNGAWPQRFEAPPDPAKFPVKPASYPQSWSRVYPRVDYRNYYTFNDGTIGDMIDIMLDAWECYSDAKYREAAVKGGDFIVLAQMPDPQPGWAQQYDQDMHPAWARKFEPPAVTGGESQSVLRTLIALAQRANEPRFLEPVPRALAYFRKSLLPDGRLARFYELQTNKPLFFTKDYQLTYDGSDVPTHYSFHSTSRLDELQAMYEAAKSGKPTVAPLKRNGLGEGAVEAAAKSAINALDARGAWLSDLPLKTFEAEEPGIKTIDSAVFVKNVDALSAYIALKKEKPSK